MNFLITGGAGSVGRDLTASLLEKGHRVRVLDQHAEAFAPLHDKNVELIQGRKTYSLFTARSGVLIPSFTWHGLFPTTRSNFWRLT
jgi:nucleoside-diphosphate-sugar epimerase